MTPRTLGAACRLAVALLLPASAALADGPRPARVPMPTAYSQECGSCHLAFPPGLLPAASWQRLMNDLPHHFGSDASLDAATVASLSRWLSEHAASGRRSAEPPPQDRITRAGWFVREHRKVPDVVWRLPSVRSPSACAACHSGAERGDFNEHGLRLPAGADPRLLREWD